MSAQTPPPRGGAQTSAARWWLIALSVTVALSTVVAAAVLGLLIVTGTMPAPWNGDRDACRAAEAAFAQVGRDAPRAGVAPSAVRQSMGSASRQLTEASETASDDGLISDLEYAAGFLADVETSLQSGNLFAFVRLSNEAATVVQQVRGRCDNLQR